jgi:sulfatase maturation enzyme AslB (radical SAM superfamily)
MESGLGVGLLTDAAWSVGKMADLVVEVCSFVRVDLDACNQQVHDRIRHTGSSRFQRVLQNVEKMARHRERRSSHSVMGAEINLTQANMNFAEEMTALARDLGLDYVRFRAGQAGPDSLLPEQRERVESLLQELDGELRSFPVYGEIRSSGPASGCRMSHFQLVVDASGDLHGCSDFRQRPDVRPFGNIHSRPVDQLWLGPERLKVVQELGESPCLIGDCRWHQCRHLLPDVRFRANS